MEKCISVVIIDDHPFQLALLKKEIEHQGVERINAFTNVDAALRWIESHKTDLVFCDLRMPGKDGIDAMLMLNDLDYQGGVVLISAVDISIISTVKAMCSDFSFRILRELTKPYDKQAIEEILALAPVSGVKNQSRNLTNYTKTSARDLLQAFESGEIVNFYQPLVSFHTNQITSLEALARWQHPEHGLLPPAAFIPLVEELRMGRKLFDAVLSNVFKDIKAGYLTNPVSINVCHSSLENPDFASDFLKRCADNQIDPGNFIIEITERETYRESVALYKNLSRLKIGGTRISIDDFGSGYSSLKKLSSLPFDEIKIDHSLVWGLTSEEKKQQIVSFICSLAKNLNIDVVAEGIEDKETWSLIEYYGATIAQGYYISRPLPVEQLNEQCLKKPLF